MRRRWLYRIKKNPIVAITFHKKDKPLVELFNLGGSIRIKEKENAVVLLIRKYNNIYKFNKW